jgi:hypothetical protein
MWLSCRLSFALIPKSLMPNFVKSNMVTRLRFNFGTTKNKKNLTVPGTFYKNFPQHETRPDNNFTRCRHLGMAG